MTDESVIACQNASVRFPIVASTERWRLLFFNDFNSWKQALNDVSLQVPHGKIVGVIGRNGAGKSTLLRMLGGVYPVWKGRVIRLGQVSTLFELGGSGGVLITGKQYIQRWLNLHSIPRNEWADLIEDIREFSELGDRLDDRIYTYSAGMAARLYFSTATSISHDIYLIDEVLSVGDEHFQSKCWKRIRERVAKGVSGVLVTHDWSAILRLCEYTYELYQGAIVAEGNSEEIICGYLKLSDQLDPNRKALFSNGLLTNMHAFSGVDWACDIPIDIRSDTPVFFNYSVEKLILGEDWQIIFFGMETLVSTTHGSYLARILVRDLPLPAGEYRLNLFLYGPNEQNKNTVIQYDMRGWTTGNSLKLYVDGNIDSGLVLQKLVVTHI